MSPDAEMLLFFVRLRQLGQSLRMITTSSQVGLVRLGRWELCLRDDGITNLNIPVSLACVARKIAADIWVFPPSCLSCRDAYALCAVSCMTGKRPKKKTDGDSDSDSEDERPKK